MSPLPRAAAVGAALAALLAAPVSARSQDPDDSGWALEAGVPVDVLGGHTTYEISAADASSSVRSKLEFPLQGVLAGVRARLSAPRGDDGGRWSFEALAQHTLGEATGTMKDSDWIDGLAETSQVGASHPGLDIYSTSKAFVRALLVDGRVSWDHAVTPALRLAPLAGLLYQRFSYTVTDANQIGYGPWAASATGSVGGEVLTYDVAYQALYVGARGELSLGRIGVGLDAWYSPFARASDEDHHLARNPSKISRTDADGSAWQVRGEGRFALGRLDALALQAGVVGYRTTGKQTQTFSDGTSMSGIDATLTSLRWSAGLVYTHRLR